MMDLYLRAADEASMYAALLAAGLIDSEGVTLDVIGTITRIVDMSDPDNPVTETLPGWHVNVRCADGAAFDEGALADVLITPPPDTPFRVWA